MNFYGFDFNNLDSGIFDIVGVDSQNIATGIFGLVVLFVAIVAVIMFWHWNKYAMKKGGLFILELVYLGGSAGLIMFAFAFLNKL